MTIPARSARGPAGVGYELLLADQPEKKNETYLLKTNQTLSPKEIPNHYYHSHPVTVKQSEDLARQSQNQ